MSITVKVQIILPQGWERLQTSFGGRKTFQRALGNYFENKKQLLSSATILYNPDLIIFCILIYFSIYFLINPDNTLFSTVLTLKCSHVSVVVMPKKRQEYNCNFLSSFYPRPRQIIVKTFSGSCCFQRRLNDKTNTQFAYH